MAEKKEKGKEKAGEAPEKSGFGVKKIILLGACVLGAFLLSMPVFLYLNGMITLKAPYIVPAEGYAAVDSLLAEARLLEEAVPQESAAAAPSEAEEPPAVGERMGPPEEFAGQSEEPAARNEPEENAGDVGVEETAPAVAEGTSESVDTVGPPLPEEMDRGETGDDDEAYRFPLDGENLARLVKVYEAMRAKQVALILNTMPERQASVILANMKEKSAASVLAELDPKKAARMSELLVRLGG